MAHGRGGKRPGAGRPKEGITKKVSLTLTQEEWEVLEKEPTYGAAVKKLIKKATETKKDESEDEKQFFGRGDSK